MQKKGSKKHWAVGLPEPEVIGCSCQPNPIGASSGADGKFQYIPHYEKCAAFFFFFNELLKSAMKNRNKQIHHLPGFSVTRGAGMIWQHTEAAQ